MKNSCYLISTVTGQIPNIVGSPDIDSLKGSLVLYLDDFLYKDSIYDTDDCAISLKELCSIEEDKEILLAFRNTPKILSSKRGNYKLTKEKFQKTVKILKPDFYLDYETQKIINFKTKEELKGRFVEPKSVEEFCELVKDKENFIGTSFINEITKNKQMLIFDKDHLIASDVIKCNYMALEQFNSTNSKERKECLPKTCVCDSLQEGYMKYLLYINEINGFIYLTIHNYNFIYKVIKRNQTQLKGWDSVFSQHL